MSPRSYANFSQIGSFYFIFFFAQDPTLLPKHVHRSPWGRAMGKSELQPMIFSAFPLPYCPRALKLAALHCMSSACHAL